MIPTSPPHLIATFERAVNERNPSVLTTCFSTDATVRDGGREYHGLSGVRSWIHDSIDRYDLSLKILDVSGRGDSWLFDAIVSGAFEGSPVQLEHHVTLDGGKISSLDI